MIKDLTQRWKTEKKQDIFKRINNIKCQFERSRERDEYRKEKCLSPVSSSGVEKSFSSNGKIKFVMTEFSTPGYLNMDLLRFTTAGSVDDGKSTLKKEKC